MRHITHRAHFQAPPELVFARATDPNLMPRYMPKISQVWDVTGRPDEVGSSYRFRERLLGRDYEGRVEVVAVDAPRTQTTLTTYDNGTTVRWEMRLDQAADQGTDGTDEIDYQVPPGIGYRILDRLVLKRQLEGQLERGAATFESMLEAELRRSRTLS
jgi:uncharacterized protein YndB with AHSA1/START domain